MLPVRMQKEQSQSESSFGPQYKSARPEVIKLEYNLKIKRNDWLLAEMCLQAANHCAFRKQPIIALYFEFEIELEFYNLEARTLN